MNHHELNARRNLLGMTHVVLAKRSHVPLSTVKRVLTRGIEHTSLANIEAILNAMGVSIKLEAADAQSFREKQAEEKSKWIVGLVQGTSALEAQAVDGSTYNDMVRQTTHELMAGPGKRLWD